MTSGITQSVGMGAAVHATARPTDASTRLAGSIEKSAKIRKHLQDVADAASFSFALVERENASSSVSHRAESAYSPRMSKKRGYYGQEETPKEKMLDLFA